MVDDYVGLCYQMTIADAQIFIMRNPMGIPFGKPVFLGTSFRILNIVQMDNGYILHTTSLQKMTV